MNFEENKNERVIVRADTQPLSCVTPGGKKPKKNVRFDEMSATLTSPKYEMYNDPDSPPQQVNIGGSNRQVQELLSQMELKVDEKGSKRLLQAYNNLMTSNQRMFCLNTDRKN